MSGILVQAGSGVPIESIFASESSGPVIIELKSHTNQKKTQKNSPMPDTDSEKSMPPTLPPSGIDPEIVHEPPPALSPEAVITPPEVDPEMTVNPQTLPDYPDFSLGDSGERDLKDPKGMPPNTGAQP